MALLEEGEKQAYQAVLDKEVPQENVEKPGLQAQLVLEVNLVQLGQVDLLVNKDQVDQGENQVLKVKEEKQENLVLRVPQDHQDKEESLVQLVLKGQQVKGVNQVNQDRQVNKENLG